MGVHPYLTTANEKKIGFGETVVSKRWAINAIRFAFILTKPKYQATNITASCRDITDGVKKQAEKQVRVAKN